MPDAYQLILTRLEALKTKNGALIARIAAELTDQFVRRGIKVDVKGRQKAPYSIWKKMERRSIAFEQLSDIYGFRILVDTVADCYASVGVAHTTWPVVPGRFKDYISTPKQNDYRSIHTTVIGPGSQRVELQIRTHEMHEVAEYGIAAHSIYKDGRPDTPGVSESRAYRGLRQTIEALASDDSERFLEHTKLELFHDQVFCFTPKGRLIALPRGATAIDFAYAVHTDIGNSAVGCKINGRIAPLISVLQNGDEVQISRSDPEYASGRLGQRRGDRPGAGGHSPRDARCGQQQFGGLGRQIVERAFERAGRKFSESKLKAALPRLARSSIDDVMVGVGRGEIYSSDVVRAVHPDFKDERKVGRAVPQNESGWFELPKAANLVFRVPGGPGSPSPAPNRLPYADSTRIRLFGSPRRAAPCRANGSWASVGRRGSPSSRSTRQRWRLSTTSRIAGSTFDGTWRRPTRPSIRPRSSSPCSTSRARSASSPRPSANTGPTSTPFRQRRAERTSATCASTCRCATSST